MNPPNENTKGRSPRAVPGNQETWIGLMDPVLVKRENSISRIRSREKCAVGSHRAGVPKKTQTVIYQTIED